MARRRKFDCKFKERVLQYAEENSAEKAARHFNVDSKRIRYWRKQRGELLLADKSRARLAGGGRKKANLELERKLSRWMYSAWHQHYPLSGKTIRDKALQISTSGSNGSQMFVASRGWLQRFLQRNNFSLGRRSTTEKRDPNLLTVKLVWFVDHVNRTVTAKGISEKDITAMDETVVWFDMVSQRTTNKKGAKIETVKTAAHERSHLTVVLAAKADGTKLKPYVVLKGAAGEVKAMQEQISSAVINTSTSGWMNDALTADWLQSVVEKFNPTPQLLVWDAYHCHISAASKAELASGYNVTAAVIPAGCTKYIQVANVMWKQRFKQSLHDACRQWMTADADGEHTVGGFLKAPSRHLLVDWVVAAWNKVDKDLIRESFKVCGLSVKPDGSEDDLILCFRKGQPCAAGREDLTEVRQRSMENQCQAALDEEDEEELLNNELVVFDDDKEENDDDEDDDSEEEDSDHMSYHCFIHQGEL